MSFKKSALLAASLLVFFSLGSGAQSLEPPSLAFDVSPKTGTTLPTQILPNQTVNAYYTVTDKTGGPFPPDLYNYVKHLPKNVTQVISNAAISDLCGETFVLSPYASCTLELEISGPVSSECAYEDSDNPCLFVCMSDGFTCAGTEDPLDVTSMPFLVAGGAYNYTYPMIAANTNETKSAESWSYTLDSGTPPDEFGGGGAFAGTTCEEEVCVAVGGYRGNDDNTYPMIAVSTQGGANGSWEYVVDSSLGLSTDYDGFAKFNNVACSGDICVAGGQSAIDGNLYPMLAVSTQSGAEETWEYVDSLSIASPAVNGIFNSTSCSGNVCIAGGQYNNGTQDYPLLAVNTNVSESDDWEYVIGTELNLPGDFDSAGNFKSVACSADTCVAGGEYHNGTNKYPLLAVNTNVSESDDWEYVIDSAASTLPTGCTTNDSALSCSGTVYGTSCSQGTCVAGGTYSDESNSYPLLAVNTDMGGDGAWNYVIDSTVGTRPTDYDHQGGFYAISCSGDVCIAGGEYVSSGPNYPMLAMSTQGGAIGTWSYAVDGDVETLPYGYNNGGSFYGATCNGDTCIAEGYYYAQGDDIESGYYPMLIMNAQVKEADWGYPIDSQGPFLDGFDGYGIFCGTTAVCNN